MAEFLTAVANTNVYTFAVAPVFTLMEVCFRERLEGLAWLSVYLHTRAWVCVRVCVCVCVCVDVERKGGLVETFTTSRHVHTQVVWVEGAGEQQGCAARLLLVES